MAITTKLLSNSLFAAVSVLPALLVLPAMADVPNTSTNAWVFGDVEISGANVRNAAFGGRRMDWNAAGTKYRNDFPNYKLVGQSFSVSDSDVYVGPVTLTLRELNGDDKFAYNYQWEVDGDTTNGNEDIDIASTDWAGVNWGDDALTVYGKLAAVIGEENASYTAGGVYLFAQKGDGTNAGKMSFDHTTAMVDGATINAGDVSVTNGSALTFVKQDASKLSDFDGGTIDSNGVTTINAGTMVVNASSLNVNKNATLNVNADNTTIKNTSTGTGALAVIDGSVNMVGTGNTSSLLFKDNNSTSHGAGLYYKVTKTGMDSAVALNSKDITFTGNTSTSSSSSGGAVFNSGGNVSILGTNNVFTNNAIEGTSAPNKLHKRGGGAVANQSYATEDASATPLDAVMVIGNENSTNTFSSNSSSMNGGAIMNRALKDATLGDNDGNAYLTINGINTTFEDNSVTNNGGAIYNFANGDRTAQVNLNGNYTFKDNTSSYGLGGAIYNTGDITFGGDAVFSGNTDSTGTNDIYNDGTITFNGNTTITGGISGNVGDLTIGNNGVLNVNNTGVNQHSITNAGRMNLTNANSSAITNTGTVNLTNANISSIANSGKIIIAGTTDTIGSVVANGTAGELQIDSSFNINDGFDWQVASITNNGSLNVNSANISDYITSIANNNTLNISALKDGVALSNLGTLNVLDSIDTGSSVLGGVVNVNNGTLASSLNGESLTVDDGASAVLAGATLSGDLVNNGNVIANGAVSVSGDTTNNNDITFNNTFAGTMTNTGSATFNGANDSVATVTNTNTVTLDGANVSQINNSGTVIINGTGTTQSKTSVLANGTAGNLQIGGTFSIDNGFDWQVASITNNGTLNLNSANISEDIESIINNNTLNLSAWKNGIALSNAGTLNVLDSINMGDTVLGGNVDVKTGTLTASLNGGSLTVDAGAFAELSAVELSGNFVNNGNVIANSAMSVNGNATNNNDITFNNTFAGTMTNTGSATFNNNDSVATVINTNTVTLNDANVSQINNSGTVVIKGTDTTLSKTFIGANDGTAGELQIDSSFSINNGFNWQVASITNNGTLDVNTANISEYLTSIANNNTGTLNISALKEGVALSNTGTLNVLKSINTGSSVLGGDVNIQAGTLTSSLNGENLTVYENAKAVLSAAILNGDFVNNGKVTANGAVSVSGDAINHNDITFNKTFAGNMTNTGSATFNGANNSVATVINTNVVTLNGANVSQIKNSGTVVIDGTGTTQSKTSVVANVTKGNLQITENGVFDIKQGFNWGLNTITNDGVLNVASTTNGASLINNNSGTLTLQNGVNLGVNRAIQNSGTVVISGSGTTHQSTTITDNNGISGVLRIADNGYFTIGNSFTWDVSRIENLGELTLNGVNVTQSIKNSGTIVIANDGTDYNNTHVSAYNNNKGNLRIAQNGKFVINPGFDWAVKSIDNYGELTLSSLSSGIDLTNSGTLNVTGGNIVLKNWTSGDINVTGGKLTSIISNNNVGANLNVANGTTALLSGATLSGDLTNNGTIEINNAANVAGNVINTGDLTVGGLLTTTSLNNSGNATLGALYGSLVNDGTVTFNNGESVFAKDAFTGAGDINISDTASVYFAGNVAGAIANDAELIFNGDTKISKSITGNGTLTVAEGSTLNIGTLSITQDNIVLDGDMFATLRKGAAQINADSSFTGNGKLNLTMLKPGSYHVFGGKTFDGIVWPECDGCISATNPVYDLVWEGGDVTATLKSIDDIAEQNELKSESAQLIGGLIQSPSRKANALIERIQEELVLEHRDAVEDAVKAVHPEQESVVQSISTSVQNTVNSLAMGRMVMPSVGRNGGDYKKTDGGFWMQGIFNKSKNASNFDGHTTGFGVGLDQTYKKKWMFGIGYANSTSKITASDRNIDIDSSSVFAYGQYKKQDWFTNAVLNYTVSGYEERGEALGLGVLANYDVKSFGANVKTGIETKSGFTPEVGLRYMHTSSDEYSNNFGMKIKLKDSDYLTSSIGSRYVFAFQANEKLVLRPELRAGLKYDLVSSGSVATVTIPGLNGYTLNGNKLSRFGGDFGLGIGTVYKGVDLSLNYDIEAREDYTSQSGMLKFRYNF